MKKIRTAAAKMYAGLDHIFTDKEAWGVFRLVVNLETIGWSFLALGMIGVNLHIPLSPDFLVLSRSFFGIAFIFYLFIIVFAHRPMGWSVRRFVFAGFIHIIPYGSLGFKMWVSRRRKNGKK